MYHSTIANLAAAATGLRSTRSGRACGNGEAGALPFYSRDAGSTKRTNAVTRSSARRSVASLAAMVRAQRNRPVGRSAELQLRPLPHACAGGCSRRRSRTASDLPISARADDRQPARGRRSALGRGPITLSDATGRTDAGPSLPAVPRMDEGRSWDDVLDGMFDLSRTRPDGRSGGRMREALVSIQSASRRRRKVARFPA